MGHTGDGGRNGSSGGTVDVTGHPGDGGRNGSSGGRWT